MAWQFEKKLNIGHVLILLGGISSGWGMYYATQSRIASVAEESRLKDTQQDGTLATLTNSQAELARAMADLRRDAGELRIDYERHAAAQGAGSR